MNEDYRQLREVESERDNLAEKLGESDGKLMVAIRERDTARAERDAAIRLWNANYCPWSNSGGVAECKHGFAQGIPCRHCDAELINGLIEKRIAAGIPATESGREGGGMNDSAQEIVEAYACYTDEELQLLYRRVRMAQLIREAKTLLEDAG